MAQMPNTFQEDNSPAFFTPEMAAGMVLQFADGTIAACNPAAESILGYTAEQLIGKTSFDPPWQTIHEDGSSLLPQDYPAIAALRTGQPCLNVVMGFYRPNGKLAWLKLDSQPLFRANESAPYAVVTTIFNVSAERQGTEEALRQSEESVRQQLAQIEAIYTTAPVGLCLIDTNLRFVRINEQLAEINGLPVSSILGAPCGTSSQKWQIN